MSVSSLRLSRPERWVLAVYDLLMRALQPLLRRKLQRRAKLEPDYGLNVAQRFGHYAGEVHAEGDVVWLHAVSLGETRAAALLLPALREAFPGMRLVLTHGTATGLEQGRALLQTADQQVWLPWDTAQATRNFLMHFKPRIGLLMETEVWPNLVQACQRAGVPLCLLNARMSEKSTRQAMRWSLLSGPAYRGLRLVLAQSVADAQQLQRLGCPDVQVVGNVKFDVAVTAQSRSLAMRWQSALSARPIVMLASTRDGEETMWLHAMQAHPARSERLKALGVLWLLVPRHPQRFEEVHNLLMQSGYRCERRSTWLDGVPDAASVAQADVILGDSLGEMPSYYMVSRMTLLGGSFAPLGGQNLIEAAACGCPVVMGPHTFNFAEAAALSVSLGAAAQVQDMSAALDSVLSALSDAAWLEAARTACMALMDKGKGAVHQHKLALACLAANSGQSTAS